MKISQKQAGLLATEVLKTLKRENIGEVSPHIVGRLKVFMQKKAELRKIAEAADRAMEDHEREFKLITGNMRNVYSHSSEKQILDQLRESKIPSLSEIEDKIILRAMFTTEESLQDFVNAIAKEYTKKKKTPVQAQS